MKPSVLVTLLTSTAGRWPNPHLLTDCLKMQSDPRYKVKIETVDKHPVDHARNYCVHRARETEADWLLMVDHDQAFNSFNPLDAISPSKQVISIPTCTMVKAPDGGPMLGSNIRAVAPATNGLAQGDSLEYMRLVGWIGAGVLFLHRSVWEQVKGPWFVFEYNDDELHSLKTFEDWHFCELMHKHEITMWVYTKMALHFKTVEVTALSDRFKRAAAAR